MAPTAAEIESLADEVLANLPQKLTLFAASSLQVADFPDDKLVDKLGLDSPYELLAMYANKVLHLYRRPILDVWCESQRPLDALIFEVMVSELGQAAHLSDEEIADLCGHEL